jgi:hypothetical protein
MTKSIYFGAGDNPPIASMGLEAWRLKFHWYPPRATLIHNFVEIIFKNQKGFPLETSN